MRSLANRSIKVTKQFVLRIANHQSNTYKPKQFIDPLHQVNEKVKTLAQLIKSSAYPIVFTGAGISTSLGIPDYRSGQNTVIKTGTGLWNRTETQNAPNHLPIDKLVDAAEPSKSHMILVRLVSSGIVKHIISQNTDGLHLKSGLNIKNISELHGNRNLEFCIKCGTKYLRNFRTLRRTNEKFKPGEKRSHFTGRSCQSCGGDLHDSIIYFGQKLPREQIERAYEQAKKADLCICIGASLTVKPSSNIPLLTINKQNSSLCIINIQQTPLDVHANLRIHYFCDQVLELLVEQLQINNEN